MIRTVLSRQLFSDMLCLAMPGSVEILGKVAGEKPHQHTCSLPNEFKMASLELEHFFWQYWGLSHTS
jgi:hypothetical protein